MKTQPTKVKNLVSIRRLEQLLGRSRDDIQRVASQAGRYYRPFDIRREGTRKWRHIDNPIGELKVLQQKIQKRILATISLPDTMLGGVSGKSIRDNAITHKAPRMLVTMDLCNCFPRTTHTAVFSAYRRTLGCSTEIAALLTQLTTFQNRLPQGAPTSTIVANLTLLPMHDEIGCVAKALGLNWTFYVDDIALSGDRACEAIEPVIRIIPKYGHSAAHHKTRKMPNNGPQKLTGTLVNRKVSADKTKRRAVANRIFELASNRIITDHEIRSIRGQIAQITWLNPMQGMALKRLADRHLPNVGIEGQTKRTDETRRCNDAKRHTYERARNKVPLQPKTEELLKEKSNIRPTAPSRALF